MELHLFMPKKQPIAKASVTSAVPARVAKPRTPRAPAVKKHSKAQSIDPVVEETVIEVVAVPSVQQLAVQPASVKPSEDRREAIAKIAYAYWEARGRQHGSADEDWTRAEAEYHSRSASKK